jgi:hypothetical protein
LISAPKLSGQQGQVGLVTVVVRVERIGWQKGQRIQCESSNLKILNAYGGDEEEKEWILNVKWETDCGHDSNLIMSPWIF